MKSYEPAKQVWLVTGGLGVLFRSLYWRCEPCVIKHQLVAVPSMQGAETCVQYSGRLCGCRVWCCGGAHERVVKLMNISQAIDMFITRRKLEKQNVGFTFLTIRRKIVHHHPLSVCVVQALCNMSGNYNSKIWMDYSRPRKVYTDGVESFLNFAFRSQPEGGKIPCPCQQCVLYKYGNRAEVYDHLVVIGIMPGYRVWDHHGESRSNPIEGHHLEQEIFRVDNMNELIQGALGVNNLHENMNIDGEALGEQTAEGFFAQEHEKANQSSHAEKRKRLQEDADTELYSGCKNFTVLSYVLYLYHAKCLFKWSNKSFSVLLKMIKKAFPVAKTFPNSFNGAKKIIDRLGLQYEKIHACPNDCMLFWKEKSNNDACSICGASRWKNAENNLINNTLGKKKRTPAKVLRFFPLKPRLKRLYMSSKTSELMKWHANDRIKDGALRHPADSEAWKRFDLQYPEFAKDPRNVQLGLASDGFNPFGTLQSVYSTWPVILMPYNLPPWLCMKQPYFILSLLIPGPNGPGNNIDVYLQPLVQELIELWEVGEDTFDASSKETFNMRAAIMWTINDFPAYGNLSGWCTYGRFACPVCNEDTSSMRLKYGKKFCYMYHRRFLDHSSNYRNDAKSFDGTKELRDAPIVLSGSEILHQMRGIKFNLGKASDEVIGVKKGTWKKRSVFFQSSLLGTLHIQELKRLESKVILTLCNFKRIFPSSFFTIMVHLVVHLVSEAMIAGPVQYCWMYPVERYLSTLKSYVRNKARPEGSIAEAYIVAECLTFCSRYLEDAEMMPNRSMRNHADNEVEIIEGSTLFPIVGKPYGNTQGFLMDEKMWIQAHRYVLFNCDCPKVEAFRNDKVKESDSSSDDINALGRGPNHIARRFKAIDMNNGYRFRTKEYEMDMTTQNSGVMVVAKTQSYASTSDSRPVFGDVIYYGSLTDILELNYYDKFRVILFRCDWVDVTQGRGVKHDSLGFKLIKLSHMMHTGERLSNEPFLFASQAQQVVFVQDRRELEWFITLPINPRDTFDMGDESSNGDLGVRTNNESYIFPLLDETLQIEQDDLNWVRSGVDGTIISTTMEQSKVMVQDTDDDDGGSDPNC
ncbi:uncharacterized protein LOC119995565 [Tripterygium wilfordii]|uniref:uncharacterized protein LOC119995565 n=1 Tax=Tripterygium wilfordii TaxID=458696 RepID=UPI0018F7F4AA|nr:uncharacterized protein LOC119995565 [Tripterygium wilfordii]